MSSAKRLSGPQMVTANRLSDGAVVYMCANGKWAEGLDAGAVAEGEAAEALLADAEKAVTDRVVVAPYLIQVARGEDGVLQPTRYRELIRARGPSFRTDLGKQAGAPQSKAKGNGSDVPL